MKEKMNVKYLSFVIFLFAILTAGCVAPIPPTSNAPDKAPTESTTSVAHAEEMKAPAFTLRSLDGKTVTIDPEEDNTIYVLNFWATWCPPCRAEMPDIAAFAKAHEGKVVFYAINLGEKDATVESYLTENNLSLPVLLDSDNSVGKKYAVRAIPTTVIIDKTGTIRDLKIGATTKDDLERSLKSIPN